MDIFGKIKEITKIIFRKDTRQIELRPNNSTTYTADRVFDLPPGDSSQVLVSATSTQTLTNKTIDADQNTITNIEDADIKSGANIARNKLASGSANHVLINDASGVFSSEAQLATSRGGTGVNSTATFPTSGLVLTEANTATGSNRVRNKDLEDSTVRVVDSTDTSRQIRFDAGGTTGTSTTIAASQTTNRTLTLPDATTTLVGTDTTQTLTNKTLDKNTIDDYVDFVEETSSPAAPSAGRLRAYARDDKKLYLKDSDGNELQVGSGGAAGRNYLEAWYDGNKATGTISTVAENGNVTNDNWHSTSTGTAFTITSSTTTPLRQLASYVSGANTAASTSGTAFFQTPRFQIDRADLGKPLTVSFDVSGVAASGDWDVVIIRYNSSGVFQERIPIAGHVSSAVASVTPSAQIGAGTYTFRGFFIPSSEITDYYALRFRRLAGSAQIRLDSLFVGPQSNIIGSPETDWISYPAQFFTSDTTSTPLSSPLGSSGSASLFYKISGDTLWISYRVFSSGTGRYSSSEPVYVGLPSGLLVTSTNSSFRQMGAYYRTTTTTIDTQVIEPTASTALPHRFGFTKIIQTSYDSFRWSDMAADATIELRGVFCVQLANRTSNIQLAERALEEFAWNYGNVTAAGAVDSTSFGWGPQGTPILVYNNTTTGYSSTHFIVQFQTPILPTDRVIVEVGDGTSWIPADSYFGFYELNTAQYGIRLSPVNSTQVRVSFGNAGAMPGGVAYGAAGGLVWSVFPGWRWRVRKTSGGAAVGFPVSTRNVIGHIPTSTSDVVPAGYIGETIVASTVTNFNQSSPASGTYYDVPGLSISVPPGIFLLSCRVLVRVNGAANSLVLGNGAIRDGSNNLIAEGAWLKFNITADEVGGVGQLISLLTPVVVSTTTTYKVSIKYRLISGSAASVLIATNDYVGTGSIGPEIRAIRIA